MDAITLLKADHKTVEKLFKSFEKAGEGAEKTKRELADSMIEELSIHAAIEEQIFYPRIRQLVPDEEAMLLESVEEHHIVKWVLSELDGLDPEDERFEPKVTVLMEMVRHHVEEEESDLFPAVREAVGRNQLQELGKELEQAKQMVPREPHPRPGRESPEQIMAGAGDQAMPGS